MGAPDPSPTRAVAREPPGVVRASAPADRAARRLTAAAERLLQRFRPHERRRLAARELTVELAFAATFLIAAAALALVAPSERALSLPHAVALVVAYVVAGRAVLYLGAGATLATELVLVPMLLLAPAPLVPLLVVGALVVGALVEVATGAAPVERVVTAVGDAWHALGPAAVLCLAGEPPAELASVPWLLAALAAQFVVDAVCSGAREWLGRGIDVRSQLGVMATVAAGDVLLAPVGLLAALAGARHRYAELLVVPLAILLTAIARDRTARLEQATDRLQALQHERERVVLATRRMGEALGAKPEPAALLVMVAESATDVLCAGAGAAAARLDDPLPRLLAAAGDPPPLLERALADAVGDHREVALLEAGLTALAAPVATPGERPRAAAVGVVRPGDAWTDDERLLLRWLAGQASLALQGAAMQEELRRQARVDDLTGLANARTFAAGLRDAVRHARASGEPLSLMLLDLDHFKQVNDRWGHQQGDLVLRRVGAALRAQARSGDLAARWGGEELAVLLPTTPLHAAHARAEGARRAIQELRWPRADGRHLRVTASVGVAQLTAEDADADALVAAADAALYRAKRGGRNRVEVTVAPRRAA